MKENGLETIHVIATLTNFLQLFLQEEKLLTLQFFLFLLEKQGRKDRRKDGCFRIMLISIYGCCECYICGSYKDFVSVASRD